MARYAAGEDAAFAELHAMVASRLYGYLMRRTGDSDLVEDLVQQTFLQVHRARTSFLAGADVMPWLLSIARRLLIDHVRRAHRMAYLADHLTPDAALTTTSGADDLVHAKQMIACLQWQLRRLPDSQRDAFELLSHHDGPLDEAATRLATSVGALKVRMHRAQNALRAALSSMSAEPAPVSATDSSKRRDPKSWASSHRTSRANGFRLAASLR